MGRRFHALMDAARGLAHQSYCPSVAIHTDRTAVRSIGHSAFCARVSPHRFHIAAGQSGGGNIALLIPKDLHLRIVLRILGTALIAGVEDLRLHMTAGQGDSHNTILIGLHANSGIFLLILRFANGADIGGNDAGHALHIHAQLAVSVVTPNHHLAIHIDGKAAICAAGQIHQVGVDIPLCKAGTPEEGIGGAKLAAVVSAIVGVLAPGHHIAAAGKHMAGIAAGHDIINLRSGGQYDPYRAGGKAGRLTHMELAVGIGTHTVELALLGEEQDIVLSSGHIHDLIQILPGIRVLGPRHRLGRVDVGILITADTQTQLAAAIVAPDQQLALVGQSHGKVGAYADLYHCLTGQILGLVGDRSALADDLLRGVDRKNLSAADAQAAISHLGAIGIVGTVGPDSTVIPQDHGEVITHADLGISDTGFRGIIPIFRQRHNAELDEGSVLPTSIGSHILGHDVGDAELLCLNKAKLRTGMVAVHGGHTLVQRVETHTSGIHRANNVGVDEIEGVPGLGAKVISVDHQLVARRQIIFIGGGLRYLFGHGGAGGLGRLDLFIIDDLMEVKGQDLIVHPHLHAMGTVGVASGHIGDQVAQLALCIIAPNIHMAVIQNGRSVLATGGDRQGPVGITVAYDLSLSVELVRVDILAGFSADTVTEIGQHRRGRVVPGVVAQLAAAVIPPGVDRTLFGKHRNVAAGGHTVAVHGAAHCHLGSGHSLAIVDIIGIIDRQSHLDGGRRLADIGADTSIGAQLAVGVVTPDPHGAILADGGRVVAAGGNIGHIIDIRRHRYSLHGLIEPSHTGGIRTVVLVGHIPGITQLAIDIIAPGVHIAPLVQGQHMLGTGSYLDNVGQINLTGLILAILNALLHPFRIHHSVGIFRGVCLQTGLSAPKDLSGCGGRTGHPLAGVAGGPVIPVGPVDTQHSTGIGTPGVDKAVLIHSHREGITRRDVHNVIKIFVLTLLLAGTDPDGHSKGSLAIGCHAHLAVVVIAPSVHMAVPVQSQGVGLTCSNLYNVLQVIAIFLLGAHVSAHLHGLVGINHARPADAVAYLTIAVVAPSPDRAVAHQRHGIVAGGDHHRRHIHTGILQLGSYLGIILMTVFHCQPLDGAAVTVSDNHLAALKPLPLHAIGHEYPALIAGKLVGICGDEADILDPVGPVRPTTEQIQVEVIHLIDSALLQHKDLILAQNDLVGQGVGGIEEVCVLTGINDLIHIGHPNHSGELHLLIFHRRHVGVVSLPDLVGPLIFVQIPPFVVPSRDLSLRLLRDGGGLLSTLQFGSVQPAGHQLVEAIVVQQLRQSINIHIGIGRSQRQDGRISHLYLLVGAHSHRDQGPIGGRAGTQLAHIAALVAPAVNLTLGVHGKGRHTIGVNAGLSLIGGYIETALGTEFSGVEPVVDGTITLLAVSAPTPGIEQSALGHGHRHIAACSNGYHRIVSAQNRTVSPQDLHPAGIGGVAAVALLAVAVVAAGRPDSTIGIQGEDMVHAAGHGDDLYAAGHIGTVDLAAGTHIVDAVAHKVGIHHAAGAAAIGTKPAQAGTTQHSGGIPTGKDLLGVGITSPHGLTAEIIIAGSYALVGVAHIVLIDSTQDVGGSHLPGSTAQLTPVIVTPGPDLAVCIHRQGVMITSSNVDNVIEPVGAAVTVVPDHLGGNTYILVVGIDAQLTILIVAPSPDRAVAPESQRKVSARHQHGFCKVISLIGCVHLSSGLQHQGEGNRHTGVDLSDRDHSGTHSGIQHLYAVLCHPGGDHRPQQEGPLAVCAILLQHIHNGVGDTDLQVQVVAGHASLSKYIEEAAVIHGESQVSQGHLLGVKHDIGAISLLGRSPGYCAVQRIENGPGHG